MLAFAAMEAAALVVLFAIVFVTRLRLYMLESRSESLRVQIDDPAYDEADRYAEAVKTVNALAALTDAFYSALPSEPFDYGFFAHLNESAPRGVELISIEIDSDSFAVTAITRDYALIESHRLKIGEYAPQKSVLYGPARRLGDGSYRYVLRGLSAGYASGYEYGLDLRHGD
ncbi:MAG: hypothetical protein FWF03_01975 [Defluviitaleaceae bacterium]|nr:hypothetical protein [Defluviitaleaceae bacterium]